MRSINKKLYKNCIEYNLPLMQYCIDKGADPNAVIDEHGSTIIMMMCKDGHRKALEFLINQEVLNNDDPLWRPKRYYMYKNKDGFGCIDYACAGGQYGLAYDILKVCQYSRNYCIHSVYDYLLMYPNIKIMQGAVVNKTQRINMY